MILKIQLGQHQSSGHKFFLLSVLRNMYNCIFILLYRNQLRLARHPTKWVAGGDAHNASRSGHLPLPGGYDLRGSLLPYYLSGRWPLESSSAPVLCPLCRAPHLTRIRGRPCFRLERPSHANDRCSLSVPVPENTQLHARLQEWDMVADS